MELKEQLRARELASASTPKDKHGRPLVSFMADDTKPEINRTSSQTSSINGPTRKFPKKRPVLASSNKEDSSVSNGAPRRPSSTSSSTHGSIRQSEPSHSSDSRQITNNTKPVDQTSVFPKANVIEPSLLLSYLCESEKPRPSILLLDVRSMEQYEKGFLNADHVVWIDPILLDQEYTLSSPKLTSVLEYPAKPSRNLSYSAL